MGSEVFLESGSWKSIEDLEDCLILEELIYLYEKTIERQHRLMKTVAAAMGADISDDSPSGGGRTFDSESGGYVPNSISNGKDVSMMPIGLGYESMI